MKILCVGAGLASASLIHFLKKSSSSLSKSSFEVIDQRPHIGGNCYTKVDPETDITIHQYGPHIFNTNSQIAWDFINEHLTIYPFTNRVKACSSRGIFSFPINLHTINQYFQTTLNANEAKSFMEQARRPYQKETYDNFEEEMLSFLGKDLYSEFIYGYTKKQWGVEPCELPASIAKRLPFRLNYNDNYYNKIYQGLPVEGYTEMFNRIFNNKNITLNLNTSYDHSFANQYDLVVFTGPIDQFFNYEYGPLSYRTVYWEKSVSEGIYQGNAVINYTDMTKPYTRINEPFYFEPWKDELPRSKSIYFTEFSKATDRSDVPFYPIRLSDDIQRLQKYQKRANSEEFKKIIFHGRLGTYRYLDMDRIIDESNDLANHLIQTFNN